MITKKINKTNFVQENGNQNNTEIVKRIKSIGKNEWKPLPFY